MIRELKQERIRLQKLLDEMEQKIRQLPQGSLNCKRNKGTNQYYINGQYANKEKREIVNQICEREYYEKMNEIITPIKNKLDELLLLYEANKMDSIYESLCAARKELLDKNVERKENVYITKQQLIDSFEKEEYENNKFEIPDGIEYYTSKGERVRSKSEKIIADELARRGIPYKYEKPLTLEEWGKKITLYPDFTILNISKRKCYILEHLGMMDDADYVANAMKKLNLYEKNGYLFGKNLLILRESSKHPLNVKILEKYIEEYLVE